MKKIAYLILFGLFMFNTMHTAKAFELTGHTFTIEPVAVVSWSQMLQEEKNRSIYNEKRELMGMPNIFYFNKNLQFSFDNYTQNYWYYAPSGTRSIQYTPYPAFKIKNSFLALLDNGDIPPPDTMGAVGKKYVMTMLNSQVRIQDKSGKSYGTVGLFTFWKTAFPYLYLTCVFDPDIVYDPESNHWIATVMNNARNPLILVAISKTADPTGTWYFYHFRPDRDNKSNSVDRPYFGFNSKWIVITGNMHEGGAKIWVLNKTTALTGGKVKVSEFKLFNQTNPMEFKSQIPVATYDANESNEYLVQKKYLEGGRFVVRLLEITGPVNNPILKTIPDSNGPEPGTGTFYPKIQSNCSIKAAQKGTSDLIDATGFIINAVFINGKLWFTHSGGLPATGTPDRTAVFWYEIDPKLLDSTGDPIVQSGVIDPGVGGCVFFPSIAVNKYNDVVIGFSRSDKTRYAEAAFVSRSSWDPPGTMSEIKTIKKGEAPYRKRGWNNTRIRWGDTSATVIDPSDNTTFWTIQEYAATPVSGGLPKDDRWGTWWAEIKPLFQDINSANYSWAKQSIIDIYTHHITTGYPDGTFKPSNNVTRAQMAAFIARAMKLNVYNQCVNPPFNDVAINKWFCPYVEAIKDAGITQGTSNGYYDPEGYVTRAQMAAFLSKSLGLNTQPCTSKPFSDVPTDAWYCPYVKAIKDAQLTTGYPDGTFKPNRYVTRAEMAVFLERSFIK